MTVSTLFLVGRFLFAVPFVMLGVDRLLATGADGVAEKGTGPSSVSWAPPAWSSASAATSPPGSRRPRCARRRGSASAASPRPPMPRACAWSASSAGRSAFGALYVAVGSAIDLTITDPVLDLDLRWDEVPRYAPRTPLGGRPRGRTLGFGPRNRGSSPCPPAQHPRQSTILAYGLCRASTYGLTHGTSGDPRSADVLAGDAYLDRRLSGRLRATVTPSSSCPESAVVASDHLGELSDHLVGHFVDQARRSGASWTDIGSAMGVTKKQAAQRALFGAAVGDPGRRPTGSRNAGSRRGPGTSDGPGPRGRGEVGRKCRGGPTHRPRCCSAKPNGPGSRRHQGVTVDQLRMRRRLPPATGSPDADRPYDGDRARKALELTFSGEAALRLGHNYIEGDPSTFPARPAIVTAGRPGTGRCRARPSTRPRHPGPRHPRAAAKSRARAARG